jgi:NADP-dependent 3-hydroxy acid dehydrogenase YdfG
MSQQLLKLVHDRRQRSESYIFNLYSYLSNIFNPLPDPPAMEKQKSVLITGCSEGGIGDALAQEFLKNGLRVFATARDLKSVQHLKELGCEVCRLDVTDVESVKGAVEFVGSKTGGELGVLVNNAGTGKLPFHLLQYWDSC